MIPNSSSARSAVPAPIPPATYSPEDVAGLLRVSVRSVRRLDGVIPGRLNIGRQVRYSRNAVDRWIESGMSGK